MKKLGYTLKFWVSDDSNLPPLVGGEARIAFAELQLAKGGGRCSGEEKQWGKEEEKEEEKKEEKEKQEVWLCDAAV